MSVVRFGNSCGSSGVNVKWFCQIKTKDHGRLAVPLPEGPPPCQDHRLAAAKGVSVIRSTDPCLYAFPLHDCVAKLAICPVWLPLWSKVTAGPKTGGVGHSVVEIWFRITLPPAIAIAG